MREAIEHERLGEPSSFLRERRNARGGSSGAALALTI
jgi:hypothetical protein